MAITATRAATGTSITDELTFSVPTNTRKLILTAEGTAIRISQTLNGTQVATTYFTIPSDTCIELEDRSLSGDTIYFAGATGKAIGILALTGVLS